MAIELVPGTVIDARYRLERLLGEGGMGVVWAAEELATGERCALKLMKDAAGDPEARQRFLREGRAASAVRHANVVGILDVIEPEGGPPVIVMELLEGESLRALLGRARTLSVAALAEIMVPVVSAVGAAHALGIVHRDLKPENIFLARGAGAERAVKVLDFGIAKLTALDGEAMRSTGITTGAVLGTPAYMAPEQVFAEKDLDHRADIWALGIIFYECLAGVCPTEGDNVGQVLKHVLSRPFEPLRQLAPDLTESVSRLVERMLAREPAQRPADLHEVLEVLEPFARTPAIPFGAPASRPSRPDGFATTVPGAPRDGRRAPGVDPVAKTARGGAPRSRRMPRRAVLAFAAAIAVLVAVAARVWWPASPPASPAAHAASPLDPPDAKLACPILRAPGVETPAGWLGAAAAAVACARARLILGGRPERILVPAELLGLPPGPVDAFPEDPYGSPEARQISVAAARQRAHAYLDGEITWSPVGFAVLLSLHHADGTEIKASSGRGRGLYEAVREAMSPLVGPGLIPSASQIEPSFAAWSLTRHIDDALGVLDLTFAIGHNAGGLPDECRRFAPQTGDVRELAALMRWLCAYTLGQAEPPPELPEIDRTKESPGIAATKIRIRHFLRRPLDAAAADADADAAFLRGLLERDRTTWGQALLAATESCFVQSADPERAYELALIAVRKEPKNTDGQMCNPWEQLATMTRDRGFASDAMRAMQAWAPWNVNGWYMHSLAASSRRAALLSLRRAYVLSPFDTRVANDLADRLVAAGRREDARQIAVEVRSGDHPVHHVASKLIQLRIEASEAGFRRALELAQGAFQVAPEDAGWVRAQRFEVAWRALEVAGILGRAGQLADVLVQRFVEPDPPVLDGYFDLQIRERIAAICTLASAAVAQRCVARLRALRELAAGITSGTEDLLQGAERYVRQDFTGAARAWRSLLRGSGTLASGLSDAMANAFEHAGEIELAEHVDAAMMQRAAEFNGATLGHVRAARRARARGDLVRARTLAQAVIDAWAMADEAVPAVAAMHQLLEQSRDRRP